ncbi:hypothetical protein CcaCcLH18_12853 [Colletotrichum camelliae]|nr:hypothetical protein CcaCcLH18_12853 [Colletotrichum camelliae]
MSTVVPPRPPATPSDSSTACVLSVLSSAGTKPICKTKAKGTKYSEEADTSKLTPDRKKKSKNLKKSKATMGKKQIKQSGPAARSKAGKAEEEMLDVIKQQLPSLVDQLFEALICDAISASAATAPKPKSHDATSSNGLLRHHQAQVHLNNCPRGANMKCDSNQVNDPVDATLTRDPGPRRDRTGRKVNDLLQQGRLLSTTRGKNLALLVYLPPRFQVTTQHDARKLAQLLRWDKNSRVMTSLRDLGVAMVRLAQGGREALSVLDRMALEDPSILNTDTSLPHSFKKVLGQSQSCNFFSQYMMVSILNTKPCLMCNAVWVMFCTCHNELCKGPRKESRLVRTTSGPAYLLDVRAVDINPVQKTTEDRMMIRDGECLVRVSGNLVEAAE